MTTYNQKQSRFRALLTICMILAFAFTSNAQEQPTDPSSTANSTIKTKTQRELGGGFARELALGSGAAYSPYGVYTYNPFLRNDTYLLVNPASIGDYGDYVWGNFDGIQSGVGSQTFAGANFSVTKSFLLGLLVNTNDGFGGTEFSSLSQGSTNLTIQNTIGFLAGYRFSPALTFGVQVFTGGRNDESETEASSVRTTSTTKYSLLGFDVGTIYEANSFRGELAVKLRLNSRSERLEVTGNPTQELSIDGGTELSFIGRAFYKLNNVYSVVPVFSFYNFSWKEKQEPAPAASSESIEYTRNAFEVGLGINAKTKNALLIGGVSFVRTQFENKTSNLNNTSGNSETSTLTASIVPRVNLGLEYYALDWLTVRLGYFRSFVSTEFVTETNTGGTISKSTEKSTGLIGANQLGDYISVGLGMHFGDWNMNFALNETFLRNGPNFVSGVNTSPLFAVFSSSYRF